MGGGHSSCLSPVFMLCFERMLPCLIFVNLVEVRVEVGEDGGGVGAAEHVFAAIFEGYKKAVGGFSVISEIFAEVGLTEPSKPTKPTATAANAASCYGRRAEPCFGNIRQWYALSP